MPAVTELNTAGEVSPIGKISDCDDVLLSFCITLRRAWAWERRRPKF